MKQCDFSFFLPFFFIYCISILYGLLVLLFVFPLIDHRICNRPVQVQQDVFVLFHLQLYCLSCPVIAGQCSSLYQDEYM